MQNDAPQMTPDQLRLWRDHMQWTQQQASDALGITRANYGAYEVGKKKLGIPHMMTLACANLAAGLGPWQPTPQPAATPKVD